MNWKSIRLELGRTSEFPAGSVSRAYLLRLPLDDYDVVDTAAFLRSPAKATARRHWSSDPDEQGFMMEKDGNWCIQCEGKERQVQFNSQPIRLGGEISVIEPNGDVLPFRIASVR